MDLELEGKAFLITGGSRGIGFQIAADAAAEGALVAICGRDRTALNAATDKLRATGVEILAVRTDLRQPGAAMRLVERTVKAFGRIDVLVNNASPDVSDVHALTARTGEDHLLSRMEGKLIPAIRCSQAVITRMRRTGGGRIIMIGGTSARVVMRSTGAAPSAVSVAAGLGNAALTNFAKHLSAEVAPTGILVNVIQPGVVATDRHPGRVRSLAAAAGISVDEAARVFDAEVPIGRTIVPRDVSGLVLFLASPWASGITGQAIAVDGGALDLVSY
jgi:NAD(P)-dependent dehydrogenase (short-subunit alcohol dehydrogenase family)